MSTSTICNIHHN